MGQPVKFAGANMCFTAPPGREDVGDLPVFANGVCIVSAWELSNAELEEVCRTRRVFLSSFSGNQLFPVFAGSESVTRSLVVDYGKVWPKTDVEGASQ